MLLLASPMACALSPGAMNTIARGGVHQEPNWLPPSLVTALRVDAQHLFEDGKFSAAGLTNTALSKQKFSAKQDRQTFAEGWTAPVGDANARMEFAKRMRSLRHQLSVGLQRPTLEPEGVSKHEMTYNWYEPGASLGRHLDEHHEETKGTKGWVLPTRRSVTWLVYLNEDWQSIEGGALRVFPRETPSLWPVGADGAHLQVGWLDCARPVFMDSSREDGRSALYVRDAAGVEVISAGDFAVPRQPIEFGRFIKEPLQRRFEQISTPSGDPRFAAAPQQYAQPVPPSAATELAIAEYADQHHVDIAPAAGTLVCFDSVVTPHLVRPLTGSRPRIAATGWFHEDVQLPYDLV
jgi:Rps23 Pro-64 3,4-dihydroxylase Tpa1-like proline 4-hydroxylase